MDIITNIQDRYEDLSNTQKKIADYIMEHAHTVSFSSLRELAKNIGASESTILSFCSKLECGNFLGLKRELQEYLKRWTTPHQKIKASSGLLDVDERSFDRLVETERGSLEETFRLLNMEELRRFVDAIKGADRIHVVGHGVSAPVSMYLLVRLQQVGFRANGLNILDHRSVVYEAANAGKNDLFVLIAFPNYAAQTVALADYLVEERMRAICLTDKVTSPIARCAEAVLLCNTDNLIFYNSMTSPMALVNLITALLVLEGREGFAAHMDKLDRIEEFLLKAQQAAVAQKNNWEQQASSHHRKRM